MDRHRHGTHVAGIAAALTNNNNKGVAGLAGGWSEQGGCRIMVLRAGYKTEAGPAVYYKEDYIPAIEYAADNGAKVINMSFGGHKFYGDVQQAIDYAYSKNCVIVAGAGNDDSDEEFYPAAYNNVLAVAATKHHDFRWHLSSYGSWVDVSAPGASVISTVLNNNYGTLSGTSMAAPHVSGLAGLISSQDLGLENDKVISRILNTADDIDIQNPGFEGQLGSGRINARRALLPIAVQTAFTNDIAGDNDGIIEPGETAEMTITLRNFTASIKYNVTGIISTNDPYVTVTTNWASYGNIPSGESASSQTPYQFTIDPSCGERFIVFDISISVNGSYYNTDVFSVKVRYPNQDGWPVSTGDRVVSSPALADVDDDGEIEIVVG